jgi:5-methylcytosine-specific restriction endonuclease McrA
MDARTLVLTPWYLPYRIVSWQHAITLMCLQKVELVVPYDALVRSPSVSLPLPAVIRMHKKVHADRYRIRFSRINVFMRDGFRCMYCGQQHPSDGLTFDHVVPRSQGGRTEWENILSACERCNTQKGNRTPHEAKMVPLRPPFKPRSLPMRPPRMDLARIPEEWRDFCLSVPDWQQMRVAS